MNDRITREKLLKYFDVTGRALSAARKSLNKSGLKKEREEILDMAERYYSDAKHYFEKGDFVTAFASLNYAHGWLDCGARIRVFDVHDSEIFAAD
ncbi:MAG: DUF357 domain-containing protein [Candidatus Woesearchaeota archaeon]|nr:DUF357 domain-containing protein [Candidatus Woesearchaeota archaeon]